MGIGASIFLIALGAILAFAVEASVAGLDIQVVGWILMVVGLIGLVTAFTIFGRRDRLSTTRTVDSGAVPGERVVERRETY